MGGSRTMLAAVLAPILCYAPTQAAAQVEPGREDLWLFDAARGSWLEIAPRTGEGRYSFAPSMSADGSIVVFHSDADFLDEGLPESAMEIWLLDVDAGELTRLTSASSSDRSSERPAISADGSFVVFDSDSDFHGEGIAQGQRELWRYSVQDGALTRLTRAPTPAGESAAAVISADGSTVAFHSTAALGGTEPTSSDVSHIWTIALATGELTAVTQSLGTEGTSLEPAISADGTRVAFMSDASSGTRTVARGQFEIWLFDATTGELEPITSGSASRSSEMPSMSADGTRIVFHSDADLLGEGRPDSVDEIWMYDTATEELTRITSTWVPERDVTSNPVLHPDTQDPQITTDGDMVVFSSDADFLEEGLPNGYPHVWAHDLATGTLSRLGRSDGHGSGAAINADASRVVVHRTPFDFIREMRVAAPPPAPPPARLTGEQVGRDLIALRAELEARFAYLEATGVDYVTAIDALAAQGSDGIDFAAYSVGVQRIISLFVDGHAGAGPVLYEPGYLPFLIESTEGRFVALRPDRSGFVDPERPYITQIDGRSVAEWVEAAAPFNPQGSPQYVERNALRQMRYLHFQRGVMGLDKPASVRFELVSAAGTNATVVEQPVSGRAPIYGLWPRSETRVLGDNVGYLRIPSMDDNAVREVQRWMPEFRDTRGLIVDVRGNGGGLRDALRALFPFTMSDEDRPRVVNAAKYRLHVDHDDGHLGGSRYMYRESWSDWSDAERQAIREFLAGFEPEWSPPDEKFSEWHYLVMSRDTNPAAYHYDRPVVVLLDQKSFSATDIFLAAFKGWPGVTLVGTPSGGGSARRMGARLPESNIVLSLASMASFQWDGQLFDGNGVQPDVVVHPDPTYFLLDGRDNVLERALELIGR